MVSLVVGTGGFRLPWSIAGPIRDRKISPAVLYAGIGTPTGPGFIGTSPHRLRGSPGMTPIRWAPVYLLFGLTNSGVR